MVTLTRKQREIVQRQQLIIDSARAILTQEGAAAITMERIATETEYAKGTIYNHFDCREDLLAAICCSARQQLLSLLEIAAEYDGNRREKLLAITSSYQLFAAKYPDLFELILSSHLDDFRSKLHASRKVELDQLETRCHELVFSLVASAIENKELYLPSNLTVYEFCFGLWSLSFGTFKLLKCPTTQEQFRLTSIKHCFQTQINFLLDGYQWKPNSAEFDYIKSTAAINKLLSNKL